MKKIALSLILALHVFALYAQTPAPKQATWEDQLFGNPDVMLPRLIDAAVRYSSQLENLEAIKEGALEERKIIQKRIYSNFSLSSSYQYGTIGNFYGTTIDPVTGLNEPRRAARPRYTVGVNVNFPLGQLLSRHNELRQQDMQLKQVDANRKTTEREIRRMVIQMYQELQLSRTTLQNQQEFLQSAMITRDLAGRRFKNGQLPLEEQISATEYHSRAVLAKEEAQNRYETQLLILEEIIGMSLIDLINSK